MEPYYWGIWHRRDWLWLSRLLQNVRKPEKFQQDKSAVPHSDAFAHESEPLIGDFHPHTHAHAGRTLRAPPHRRPVAVLTEAEVCGWAARGEHGR